MKQIANEFETQRVDEYRTARRRETFARIRKVVLVLAILGLSGAAYAYRTDIKSYVTEKLALAHPQTDNDDGNGNTSGKSAPKGAAASAVNAAQANAKVRDAVIDGMIK